MFIDNDQEFNSLLKKLLSKDVVALDTEFHWTKTYSPIPALLQIADDEDVYLVDLPLVKDYKLFKELLEKPEIVKLFHSCDQDMLLIDLMCGARPTSLFDTQLAAAVCGDTDNLHSYAKLVKLYLDIELSKGCQRSDWLARPLSEKQLRYAEADVTHLYKLYPILKEKLETLNRLDWVYEDTSIYAGDDFYTPLPDRDIYRKIKGCGRLKRRNIAIVREVAEWREKQARKIDRRPRRVLSDKALLDMATKKPANPQALAKVYDIGSFTVQKNGTELLRLVEVALKLDENNLPPAIGGTAPSKEEEKVEKLLFQVLAEISEECKIAETVLSSRANLRSAVYRFFKRGEIKLDFLNNWRSELLAEKLTETLQNSKK